MTKISNRVLGRPCVLLTLVLACLTVGVTVLAQTESAPAAAGLGYVPHWQVGDSWVLEASYRDLRSPGEVWLPPIRWVFKVRAIKSLQRQDCYVVQAYPKSRHLKVQAILYLSTIDLRPLRVIDIFPTKNGVKSQDREIDPFRPEPLGADTSLVPYDLPLFPLVRKSVQRADGFQAYQAPEPRKIDKFTSVGGFRFKRSVKQAEKKPDQQHADVFRSFRSTGETFQVEISDDRSGDTLTQVWQEGSPWALSSDSRARKVRLLPRSAPTSLPADQNGGK